MTKSISYKGVTYRLAFCLDSMVYLEDIGFDGGSFDSRPFSMLSKLVNGAFHMHHPELSMAETNEIYVKGVGAKKKGAFISDLTKMYEEVAKDIMGDEGDEGNSEGTAD